MKKIYLSALICMAVFTAGAQMNLGIQSSNWSGVSGTTWNPAISDSKYAFDMSLGGINSGFIQNDKGISPSGLFQNTGFKSIFGIDLINLDVFAKNDFTKSLNSGTSTINLTQFAQIEGPGSFMFPFGNNKNAFAISWHLNAARTITGMDPQLAVFADQSQLPVSGGNPNSFTIANASWIDYDITYGRTLYDKGKHFFKMGVTLKILHILEASSVQANLNSYNVSSSSLDVSSGSIDQYSSNTTSISAAGDIGFVYEYRPRKDKYRYDIDTFHNLLPRYKNLYTLAVGFSVMDIGAIPLNNATASGSTNTTNSSISFSTSDFDVLNKAPLSAWTSNNSGKSAYAGASSIWLPTRFNLYLDYNSKPGLGVNVSTTISPVFKSSSPQIAYGSSISITPRFDLPLFGLYIPLSYHFNGNLGAGFAMRGGPVWVGISDVIGLAKSGGMNNGIVYAAVKIPIIFHRKYDKDGDKVSNKFDLCAFEKGTWQTQGCNDKDGDGLRDSIDQCPDQAGPAYLKGCPDVDGDSIPDREDSCMNNKGPLLYHGCPDTDGDGIIDKYDECPAQAGPKEFNGCPDTDSDGVPDKIDECPKLKGDKEHKGCPDTDGDGLYDNPDQDHCPLEFGPKENHGCPYGDSDDDGINDHDDMCPKEKGPIEYHGCPTPVHVPLGNFVNTYDSLLFESGKKDISIANLQRVKIFANLMNTANKNYTIRLIGHTDNVEADSSTRHQLSVDRAESVRQELIKLGVENARIEVDGYGDEQPAADNKSAILRKFNRRVQLLIVVVGGE